MLWLILRVLTRRARTALFLVLFLLVAIGSLVPQPHAHPVPINSIGPNWCIGDGRIVAAWVDANGVDHFRCSDGFQGIA